MTPLLTVAAYQGPPIINNEERALEKIQSMSQLVKGVDILTFPETFLHGYFDLESDARQTAIDLSSSKFRHLLEKLSGIQTTLIIGINEIEGEDIYNTCIIIEKGVLLGKARKSTTYPPYNYYSLSRDYPVFYKNKIGFGVCICCDINHFKHAHQLSVKGAQIIFCPMWNVIDKTHSLLPHIQNKAHLIARAQENHVWLVCSDVIFRDDQKIGVGCSCIIDPLGRIVAEGQPLTENVLTYHIAPQSVDSKLSALDRQRQVKHIKSYSN